MQAAVRKINQQNWQKSRCQTQLGEVIVYSSVAGSWGTTSARTRKNETIDKQKRVDHQRHEESAKSSWDVEKITNPK